MKIYGNEMYKSLLEYPTIIALIAIFDEKTFNDAEL